MTKSSSLKAYLEAGKRETRLLGAVERHMLLQPFDERDQKVIHPSDLIKKDWCALAAYHALKGNYIETRERPNLRTQSIFDTGHAIHAKWQNYLKDMGVLYGRWYCPTDNRYEWGLSKDPNIIGTPSIFDYAEVPLHSKKHMIYGHSDGWVKGLGEDFLVEIKSIGPGTIRLEAPALIIDSDLDSAWKNIRNPFTTHLLQGQVYLHLAHLMVEAGELESAPNEIVFIYELKATQDYKEFVVSYTPNFVEHIFEAAADVVWAVENDRPPVCTINSTKGCKRCEPFGRSEVLDEEPPVNPIKIGWSNVNK